MVRPTQAETAVSVASVVLLLPEVLLPQHALPVAVATMVADASADIDKNEVMRLGGYEVVEP